MKSPTFKSTRIHTKLGPTPALRKPVHGGPGGSCDCLVLPQRSRSALTHFPRALRRLLVQAPLRGAQVGTPSASMDQQLLYTDRCGYSSEPAMPVTHRYHQLSWSSSNKKLPEPQGSQKYCSLHLAIDQDMQVASGVRARNETRG